MKGFYLLFLLFIYSVEIYAQPPNYWSMGSNTESSILAGAVVGGGSGITSIYYNPAGISELTDNKISLDASLFHFNLTNYKKPFSSQDAIDYLDYQVQPRFFSFVHHPKIYPKLSLQYAVFGKGRALTKLYDSGKYKIKEAGTNEDKILVANFNYENRYSDTWFGFGASYQVNDNLAIGMSLLLSAKTFLYYEDVSIDLFSSLDTAQSQTVSKYVYIDRQDLYVFSGIAKFGLTYHTGSWSLGLNISTPSLRFYGDGFHRRDVSMINVNTDAGLQPDFVKKETNYHLVSNFKEPLAIAFGVVKENTDKNLKLYFSTEYFFAIDDYKVIDNSRIANIYTDEYSPGSDFLSYIYGGDHVLNVAIGLKKIIKPNLAYMLGFKTNFSSYNTHSYDTPMGKAQYVRGYSNLFHLTTGVKFDYKKTNVLIGVEYTFGLKRDLYQFRNFEYSSLYDTHNYYAMQSYPKPEMHYIYNGIGFYFGLGFNF